MKKLVAALVIMLSFGLASAEGTKVLKVEEFGISITVSEMAPDFLKWDAAILGQDRFMNGNRLSLVSFNNPDETVIINCLFGLKDEKLYVLAFAVLYIESMNVDIYEDLDFIRTGVPTSVLVRVKDASPTEVFRVQLSKIQI
jgi:hypothetical protein